MRWSWALSVLRGNEWRLSIVEDRPPNNVLEPTRLVVARMLRLFRFCEQSVSEAAAANPPGGSALSVRRSESSCRQCPHKHHV